MTAGPTQEKLDPVRYISNHSTGKMGYAIARQAMLRGAEVTLVSGKVNLQPPMGVRMVPVVSAADMAQAVKADAQEQDIIIKAAAVADYRPAVTADEKLKKKDDEMNLVLERTEDILAWLGAHRRPGQFLCGFSMETEHMLENSRAKLEKKKIDMIVANNLKQTGAGFGTDTNVVTLLTKEDTLTLPIMSKEEVADRLLTAMTMQGGYQKRHLLTAGKHYMLMTQTETARRSRMRREMSMLTPMMPRTVSQRSRILWVMRPPMSMTTGDRSSPSPMQTAARRPLPTMETGT